MCCFMYGCSLLLPLKWRQVQESDAFLRYDYFSNGCRRRRRRHTTVVCVCQPVYRSWWKPLWAQNLDNRMICSFPFVVSQWNNAQIWGWTWTYKSHVNLTRQQPTRKTMLFALVPHFIISMANFWLVFLLPNSYQMPDDEHKRCSFTVQAH